MRKRAITAWLIRWEWMGDHAAVEQPYVDILSARKGPRPVLEYVQRLHDLSCTSLSERAERARYNIAPAPAYEATIHRRSDGMAITCGHNPYLLATLVRNLSVEVDPSTGKETLKWEPYSRDEAQD